MQTPTVPENEAQRVESLFSYSILDSLPEKDFDDLVKLASSICNTPISLVTLVDSTRQWFKAKTGLEAAETPRDYAFCAHAINNASEVFIVPDSRLDKRFFDNPLVTGHPNVIFYAGVPLVNPQGFALGTICIIDNKPKNLTEEQIESLRIIARQVINLLELRRRNIELGKQKEVLEEISGFYSQTSEVALVGGWDVNFITNQISWTPITKQIHEAFDDFDLNIEKGINFYTQGKTGKR